MPRLTTRLVDKLITRSQELERTRSKIENLLTVGYIELNDIEQVYAGLYLDIFTEFEAMIEDLFFGLLSGSLYSRQYKIERKVRIQPVSMTRQVISGDRSYLDWFPYRERTIPRAKNFFDVGEPFTLLVSSQEENLDNYYTIRNALAHKSETAYIKFQKIIDGLTLLPQERSPAGYLRSRPYAASPQTQYEIAVLELETIAKLLCS